MKKIFAVGITTIILSGTCFFSFTWYQSAPELLVDTSVSRPLEESKTGFLSIAVFKEGKVDGYLTIRSAISLNQKSSINETEYFIMDILHRNLNFIPDLSNKKIKKADLKNIENFIVSKLKDMIGDDEIKNFKIVDIFYDKRKTSS